MSNTNAQPKTKRVSRKKQAAPKESVAPSLPVEEQKVTKGRYVVLETHEYEIREDMTVEMITDFIQSNSEHLDKISCGLVKGPFLLTKFYFLVCVKRTLEISDGVDLHGLRDCDFDNPMAAYWATSFKMANTDLMARILSEQVQLLLLPTFTSMFVCEEIPKSSRCGHTFIYDYIEKTVVHLKFSNPDLKKDTSE